MCNRLKKGLRLRHEQFISFPCRSGFELPHALTGIHPGEMPLVIVKSHGPILTDNGDCGLIRRLVLIERIASQHVSVPREDVNSVLNQHSAQFLVLGVSNQLVGGADEPLARVEQVCQCILNSPAARSMISIIGVAICLTIPGNPVQQRQLAVKACQNDPRRALSSWPQVLGGRDTHRRPPRQAAAAQWLPQAAEHPESLRRAAFRSTSAYLLRRPAAQREYACSQV